MDSYEPRVAHDDHDAETIRRLEKKREKLRKEMEQMKGERKKMKMEREKMALERKKMENLKRKLEEDDDEESSKPNKKQRVEKETSGSDEEESSGLEDEEVSQPEVKFGIKKEPAPVVSLQALLQSLSPSGVALTLNDALLAAANITPWNAARRKSSALKKSPNGDGAWASALVLAVLERKFPNQKAVWVHLRESLLSNISNALEHKPEGPSDAAEVEAVIAEAAKLIQ